MIFAQRGEAWRPTLRTSQLSSSPIPDALVGTVALFGNFFRVSPGTPRRGASPSVRFDPDERLFNNQSHLDRLREHIGKIMNDWEWQETLIEQVVRQVVIVRQGQAATFEDVIQAWRSEEEFREWFHSQLREVPFEGYLWQAPPVSGSSRHSLRFEFVLRDEEMDWEANPAPFCDSFEDGDPGLEAVCCESGHGNTLVLPRPDGPPNQRPYGHLQPYIVSAGDDELQDFWKLVGECIHRRLDSNPNPVWLNAGGSPDVPWLHVRLDNNRPDLYWQRFA